MSLQRSVFETIGNMIWRYVPGSDEEKQLVHLIDANAYMRLHKCTLAQALSATAKKRPGEVARAKDQLDHLKRAKAYMEANGGTLTGALHKTATSSGTSRNCLEIAEQLDHLERARNLQMETHCGLEEALSMTAPRQERTKT